MFGRKKSKDEHAVTVRTKSELESAMKNKEPQIVVTGELAKKMKCLSRLSKASIAALIVGTATVVIPPVAPVAATAGGSSVAAIIAASGLALGTVIAVLKGYTVEIEKDKVRLIAK